LRPMEVAIRPTPSTGTGLPGAPRGRSLRAVPVEVGEHLSLGDVVAVARGEPATLSEASIRRMAAARGVVVRKVAAGETVYGVTTGFGSLATVRLAPEEARDLQHGLLRTHAVGVGPPLAEWEVRGM